MSTASAVSSTTPAERRVWVYPLFFVSGFAALIYQVAWQRSLFALFGINIEAVTIIVTAFMLGLGVGSLAGGVLSRSPDRDALRMFGVLELLIALFGCVSLALFERVGDATLHSSLAVTALAAFLLLLVPTVLMGATLPLLVAAWVRATGNVGRSVAELYCVNTLGSAMASIATALVLLATLGVAGSVWLAALLNALVGTTALVVALRRRSA